MKQTQHYMVTGGAGFLGSRLCENYSNRGMKSSAWTTFTQARNQILWS